jgi:GGDEF domain-containing protein
MRSGEILAAWKPEQIAWLMLDANEAATEQAIQRVRVNLENTVFKDEDSGLRFFFTAIFGAAVYEPGISENEWMSRAEEALQTAENSGANGYSIREHVEESPVPGNGRDVAQAGRVNERTV